MNDHIITSGNFDALVEKHVAWLKRCQEIEGTRTARPQQPVLEIEIPNTARRLSVCLQKTGFDLNRSEITLTTCIALDRGFVPAGDAKDIVTLASVMAVPGALAKRGVLDELTLNTDAWELTDARCEPVENAEAAEHLDDDTEARR